MTIMRARVLIRFGLITAIFGGLLAVAPLAEPWHLVKLAALAAGGLLAWLGLWRVPLRSTPLDRPLAALWAVMLLSTAFSAERPTAIFGAYPQPFYGLLPLGLCTALYYAVAMSGAEAPLDDVLDWLLVASLPFTVYGVAQRLGGDFILHATLQYGRIISTIGSPVMLGACLVPLVPLALHRALEKKGALAPVACGLIVLALVMTWARGAWISAAAAVALYLLLTGRARRKHVLALLLIAPVALFALQRALKKEASDSMRVEMIRSAATIFRSSPWLGSGPDNFQNPFRREKTDAYIRVTNGTFTAPLSAHDDLIQVLVTLGLLGLLAYAWLLWALATGPVSISACQDRRIAAIAAGLAGLFLQAKVNPIPISALALAAAMTGLAARQGKPIKAAAGRAAAALAAVFCAASLALLARVIAADAAFMDGQALVSTKTLGNPAFMVGVNDVRRATELNPWLLDYLSLRCAVIFRILPYVPPEQGRQLIDKTLQLTEDGVRRHPGSPTAHDLRATALALSASRYGSGRMAEALAEIKTASEMDPTFTFTLRRRIEIARALGDKAEFDQATAQYRHVIALTHEPEQWTPLLQ